MIALIPLFLSFVFTSTMAMDEAKPEFVPIKTTWDDVASMRELRYADVIGQQDWWTCGAATVATWLTYFLDQPTTESQVLTIAVGHMLDRGQKPGQGLSLLSLRETMVFFGIPTSGYRVEVDVLKEHFASGGYPVLIHMTNPRFHYALAVGVYQDSILLADPSFGRRALSFDELVQDKGFDGVVLVAEPDPVTARTTTAKQNEFVASFTQRYEVLRHLREVIVR